MGRHDLIVFLCDFKVYPVRKKVHFWMLSVEVSQYYCLGVGKLGLDAVHKDFQFGLRVSLSGWLCVVCHDNNLGYFCSKC